MTQYLRQSSIYIINIEKNRIFMNKGKRVIMLCAKKLQRMVSFKQKVVLILSHNELHCFSTALGNIDL